MKPKSLIALLLFSIIVLVSCSTVTPGKSSVPESKSVFSSSESSSAPVSVLPSPSESSSESPSGLPPVEDPLLRIPTEELEKMKGETVRVLIVDADALADPSLQGTTEKIKTAIEQRNSWLEEKMGVKIVTEFFDYSRDHSDYQEKLDAMLYSSDPVYDVVVAPSNSNYLAELRGSDRYFRYWATVKDPRFVSDNFKYLDLNLLTPTPFYDYNSKTGEESYEEDSPIFYTASEIDPVYSTAMGVCYVNTDLFEKYKNDISKLESSGGYGTLDEIVKNGYWTLDLIDDLCTLFAEKSENASVFLPSHEIAFGAKQVDLFFAGCGKKTSTQNGYRYKDDDYTKNYLSTMGLNANEELYNRFFALWNSSGTDIKNQNECYEKLKKGEILLSFDALSAFDAYSLKGSATILPLPMENHAQYSKEEASLGYRSVLLASEGYAQIAIIRHGADTSRQSLICATLSELAYLSHEIVTPVVYENLNAEQLYMISLCKNGLFSDVTRTWNVGAVGYRLNDDGSVNYDQPVYSSCYYKLFGDLAAADWSKGPTVSFIRTISNQHTTTLREIANYWWTFSGFIH